MRRILRPSDERAYVSDSDELTLPAGLAGGVA